MKRRGLDVVNVMWEDTGRAEGSALGPNISDFTLQVRQRQENGQWLSGLMPVIRFPNFTDRTGDVKHSWAAIDAAQRDLGYRVLVDLKEGLRRTVEY